MLVYHTSMTYSDVLSMTVNERHAFIKQLREQKEAESNATKPQKGESGNGRKGRGASATRTF